MLTMSFNVHKSGDDTTNYFQIWISNQQENVGKQAISARQILIYLEPIPILPTVNSHSPEMIVI